MPHIDGADAGDVAITAAEGGIGYWCQIDAYKPSRWARDDARANIDVPDDFVFFEVAEYSDDHGEWGWNDPDLVHEVTPNVLNRGLRLFVDGDYKSFGFDPFDIETIDSDAADVIVQLGIFGRLIYG